MLSRRDLRESYHFCGRLAKREARNFYYAFLLLPPARRRSMCALYAFMRQTDDLADEPGDPDLKREALAAWGHELDGVLSGKPARWPGLPALADTVARHAIPAPLLHEVIEGVSMDIVPRTYHTFDELSDYCYHVASVVGLCCIHIWGYHSQSGEAERLAIDCGIALQLTNIIRDVREDARNGRIYLPGEDLTRFSVSPDELTADAPSNRVRALLAFEAARAYSYYDRALGLVPLVDRVGRPVLRTIMGIYRSLLDEIVRRDYNVLKERVSISGWKKSAIAVRALSGRLGGEPRTSIRGARETGA
jgi:phytoene synthase